LDGRPKEFGSPVNKIILGIADEQADLQQRASAPLMQKRMVKKGVDKVPSESTTRRLKHEMKFTIVNVFIKPFLSGETMKARAKYARAMVSADWSQIVVIDEVL